MILRIFGTAALAVCLLLPNSAFAQNTPPAAQTPPAAAQSASPLDEMVAHLRPNQSDDALRNRIIERVAQMRIKPAIPEEARRAFVQGNAAFGNAQAQRTQMFRHGG